METIIDEENPTISAPELPEEFWDAVLLAVSESAKEQPFATVCVLLIFASIIILTSMGLTYKFLIRSIEAKNQSEFERVRRDGR